MHFRLNIVFAADYFVVCGADHRFCIRNAIMDIRNISRILLNNFRRKTESIIHREY